MPTIEQQRAFDDAFLEFGRTHPDFLEKLAQAQKRAADGNIDLPIAARDEIKALGKDGPQTLYTILTDEHEAAALHVAPGLDHIDDDRARDRVRRIHSRDKRNGKYQASEYNPFASLSATDLGLWSRKDDIRSGKRRR